MEFKKIKIGMQVQVKLGTSKIKCNFWHVDHDFLLKYEGRVGKVMQKDSVDNTFKVEFAVGDSQWLTPKRVDQVIVKEVSTSSNLTATEMSQGILEKERIDVEDTIQSLKLRLKVINERIEEVKLAEYPFNFKQLSNRSVTVSGVYLSNSGYELYVNMSGEVFYLGRVGCEDELQVAKPNCWESDKFKSIRKTLKLAR